MLRNVMNKKKKKKGFTLIELVIVIAIIGILAAVALPKYMEVRETANVKSDITSAKNIATIATNLVAENKIARPAASTFLSIDIDTAASGTQPAALILGQFQEVPVLKAVAASTQHYFVRINSIGDVSVFVGDPGTNAIPTGTRIFPDGQNPYN